MKLGNLSVSNFLVGPPLALRNQIVYTLTLMVELVDRRQRPRLDERLRSMPRTVTVGRPNPRRPRPPGQGRRRGHLETRAACFFSRAVLARWSRKGLPSVPGRNHWRPIISNPKGNAMSTDQKSGESSGPTNASGQGKKLLERAWDALLAAGLAEAVARQYVCWMRDYVLFHGKRHPQEMGVPEVRAFLADGRFRARRRQRVEATAAIRFLYEVVLQRHWPRGVLDDRGPGEPNCTCSPIRRRPLPN